MKRKSLVLMLSCVILATLALFLFARQQSSGKRIERAFANTDIVSLSQATTFGWKSVIIIGPYTTAETLRNHLADKVDETRVSRLVFRDDVCMLVFIDDTGSVCEMPVISRSVADFASIELPVRLSAKDAVFLVNSDRTVELRCD